MASSSELTLRLIPNPRTLLICSSTHALIFRPSPNHPTNANSSFHRPEVVVEFTEMNECIPSTSVKLSRCCGCLGLLELEQDIFLSIVTHTSSFGSLDPSRERIHRILAVDFICITSAAYDHYQSSNGPSADIDDVYDHPAVSGIKKIVSNGQFYYSTGYDLSSRLESRLSQPNNSAYDPRFLWNSFMLAGLSGFKDGLSIELREEFDRQGFLTPVIQGYMNTYELKLPALPTDDDPQPTPIKLSISVISRLGSRRAGTRFITRGIDDDGNVANFVETETLVSVGSALFSYVQVRGSVPVFFEQSGTGMTNVIGGLSGQGHRIQLTRTGVASQPAFERHFEDLLTHHPVVHVINLLSCSREGEVQLSQAYVDRYKALTRERVGMTHFDLHQRAKLNGLEGVRHQLASDPQVGGQMDRFGYCLAALQPDGTHAIICDRQQGVFRTNCLDCLDRTNVIQDMLSRMAVESFLAAIYPHLLRSDYLWNCHRTLWADNGDALSKIYAGTGALNTSFTRGGKQTFSGILSNASKSVGRMYNSNFVDKSKQANIDLLLGNLNRQKPVKVFDPINDTVKSLLYTRQSEYSSALPISIWVGTYNLNGRMPPASNHEDLTKWLWPSANVEPDIMVVAFQEIVKLSPQQIMVTDPEKKRRWERSIMASLDQRPDKRTSYVILRSDQLVGTALIILVKSEMVHEIRSVEATTKKTGMKGMAGNKGAVSIRLQFHDTTFCFVTAHFAAGYANVDERNHDYVTIANELEFLKGKTISSHENVIWAGDFNYRIGGGLSNEFVRQAIVEDDLMTLLAADQLLANMATQVVFPRYLEGQITFPPTYKYDPGTDRYDTSEKMRIPAWTDRILYQGDDLDLTHYSRADLKASDHRPVYAIIRAQVRVVDRAKKEEIRRQVMQSVQVKRVQNQVLAPIQSCESRVICFYSMLFNLTIASSAAEVPSDQPKLDEWWKTPGK
ncbi:hypothetical protein CROQUDRAFT_52064 [Cronartium quercuum f. sp. fusiforme G11]|uniref:phosphoinositide 5-phosphatase n=1 Tax=Cronartium quercuum f. sp. fusiforme G11 TaxID=708437 RepID=A0A9P6NCC3_9BASI|nr:hypothetical protein CROQUDRAFT_52064 [Cronartium quercuum f. sp. fusiforme G11]